MLTNEMFQNIVYDIMAVHQQYILKLAEKTLSYQKEHIICLLEIFPSPIEELLVIAENFNPIEKNYGEIQFVICAIPHEIIVEFFVTKEKYSQFIKWLNVKTKSDNVNFIYAGVKLLSGEIDISVGAN